MKGNVLTLFDRKEVDAAWAEFQVYARQLVDNPRLLLDREFFEEMTRREARFKKLFLGREVTR